MDLLKSMDPCDLIVLCTAVAVCLSDDLSANELNVLGNFIVAVGGLILTWAAQKQSISSASSSSDRWQISLSKLESTVKDLQKRLESLER